MIFVLVVLVYEAADASAKSKHGLQKTCMHVVTAFLVVGIGSRQMGHDPSSWGWLLFGGTAMSRPPPPITLSHKGNLSFCPYAILTNQNHSEISSNMNQR